MSNQPILKITDNTKKFKEMISRFKNDDVLVGIPQDNATREDGDPINNAALLFINNFGSPAQNIPPRPVMEIGIRNAQAAIAEQFKKAFQRAWAVGLSALDTYYERAGIIASNSIKKAINSQEGIQEPAESTLKSRESKGFKGTKALIVTGQMRNAITYVIRGKS